MDVNTILQGDCLQVLKTLPEKSVQCVVTSPPYYGLRDYGTASWIGGDETCDHTQTIREAAIKDVGGHSAITGVGHQINAGNARIRCCPCGASRQDAQIGLEETPAAYIEKLVNVFREVWRVLRDDGTCWLNLGDSYATTNSHSTKAQGNFVRPCYTATALPLKTVPSGFKPKDLMMMPARVAIALQDDGWYLRSDIIWHKPTAMPESVSDRPTSAHEHIFLLAKSERYYYDADAIREPLRPKTLTTFGIKHHAQGNDALGLVKSDNWGRTVIERQPRRTADGEIAGANKRNVWTVTSQPYKEAHFATMPPKLVGPCILAGSRPGDVVLDPFMGAGTVALVALQQNRNYLGIELNPAYIELAYKRIAVVQPVLWEVSA